MWSSSFVLGSTHAWMGKRTGFENESKATVCNDCECFMCRWFVWVPQPQCINCLPWLSGRQDKFCSIITWKFLINVGSVHGSTGCVCVCERNVAEFVEAWLMIQGYSPSLGRADAQSHRLQGWRLSPSQLPAYTLVKQKEQWINRFNASMIPDDWLKMLELKCAQEGAVQKRQGDHRMVRSASNQKRKVFNTFTNN